MQKKVKNAVMLVVLAIIIAVAVFTGIMIEKNTPSKTRMDAAKYFGIEKGDTLVWFNHERLEEPILIEDGQIYLPVSYVYNHFNKRFYTDMHTNEVLYTTAKTVYTLKVDSNTYTDSQGNTYTENYKLLKEQDGELFLPLDLVKKYADFNYRYYADPSRLMIWNQYEETNYVSVEKDTQMRFEESIKSDIIKDLAAGDSLEYIREAENGFVELRSEDGFTGYVQKKAVSTVFTRTEVSSFVPEEQKESIHFSAKINLAWHVLGASVGGKKVQEDLAQTKGINVLSPTWYSITSADGEVSSFANKSYVEKCHELGIMVWPLIDDFAKGLDGMELYSRKETRKKLIDFIISESKTYGFDGINIDFEKVNEESAVHYLQFIRELSLACAAEKLVLSIDNYVPMEHNMYYDRSEQGVWADYIIIMGYDEHWSGSDAGSVASIGFVESGIKGTLDEVPAEKVLNAMPFYTRIWVETPKKDGTIETTSKAVGMKTAYDTIKKSGFPAIWDEDCAQYYCAYDYADGDSVVKIWLEDAKSIEAKMELFKQYDLAGIAAWRLGFETPDVWDVILKYIS